MRTVARKFVYKAYESLAANFVASQEIERLLYYATREKMASIAFKAGFVAGVSWRERLERTRLRKAQSKAHLKSGAI